LQSSTPNTAPFLRLGTRGSPLALAQAHMVRSLLARHHRIDEATIEIKIIKTDGDRTQSENLSLKDIGGKGLFSREIEEKLLDGSIDVGVHSAKDMATTLPRGLVMDTYLEREDVRDAFISHSAKTMEDLPQGARIGTSSLRRAAQMRHFRPDLEIVEFRGNVDTRLQKLADNIADATLLAVAGLNRLGKSAQAVALLDPETFPPAPAQGAVGLQTRADDTATRKLIAPLNHKETLRAVEAERAMLGILDGSCRTPIGVLTRSRGDYLEMKGQLLSPNGKQCFTQQVRGNASDAIGLGQQLGEELLACAGPEFIAALKRL
jgi:hydroxymethylbilane synthase